ncbi:MAG TPA: hypothetical protein VHW09_22840 [Bryobacteraceae bacterium]|jgi:hypothetical protein|nr:hypothetical protein [Bryobacteraceae bacterium]
MAKAIAGFFRTRTEGEKAKAALYQAGYTDNEVGFVTGDVRGHETPAVGPVLEDEGSESEAGRDAFIGAAVGVAAGLVAVLLPGFGWLIAAGPLVGAFGGMTTGVAVGGLYGILKDHSISDDEAQFYAEGVRRGGSLITVHGVDTKREAAARKILDDNGAIDVEQLADEQRATPTGGTTKTLKAG